MNKRLMPLLLGFLLVLPAVPVRAASTYSATMNVQESQMLRDDLSLMMGAGSEWNSDGGLTGSRESLNLSAEYLEGAGKIVRMPLARTAGASMNYFFWNNSIGPYAERGPAGKGIWSFDGATNFGPVEWVKANQAIDPDCQFIVGLNLLTESAELNGQYAEFMTADASSSALGAKRASCGLAEPVRVAAFELGNELDWGDVAISVEDYCRRAKETIRAVRAKVPNAKFIVCGKTYPLDEPIDSMNWRGWNRTVLAELGGEADYISHHAYYDGQALAKTEQYLDVMASDILEMTGSDRIKLAFTEQATWPGSGVSGDPSASDSNALRGVLSTSDFLNRMISRTDAWSANYFMFPGELEGYWGMMGPGKNETKWYLSGIAQLYNLYAQNLCRRVVASSVSSGSKYAQRGSNDCRLTTLATADGDTLKLVLTNKSEAMNFNLSFGFEHPYRLVSELVFSAPAMTSKVTGASSENIFTRTSNQKNVNNFSQYSVPEKSVVFLTLERMDGSAAAFSDNFESYPVMNQYQTGRDQTIGTNWKISGTYRGSGWMDNFMGTKVTTALDGSGTKALAVKGYGVDSDACVNLLSPRHGAGTSVAAGVDVYHQGDHNTVFGLRLADASNEKSYYEIATSHQDRWGKKLVFRKVTNGTVVKEDPFTDRQALAGGWSTLELRVENEQVVYGFTRSGTETVSHWQDSSGFAEGTVFVPQLYVMGDSADIYFDQFSYRPLAPGEPEKNAVAAVNAAILSQNHAKLSEAVLWSFGAVPQLSGVSEADRTAARAQQIAAGLMVGEPFCGPDGAVTMDFVRDYADSVRGELAVNQLVTASSAGAAGTVLKNNNRYFRLNLNSEASKAVWNAACGRMAGKSFASLAQLRDAYRTAVALEQLRAAQSADEMKRLVADNLDQTGCDEARYYALADKAGLGAYLLAHKSELAEMTNVRTLIDGYVSADDTQTVFTDDFQSLPLMTEYQKGKGRKIGENWQVSWVTNAWDNGAYTMIAQDPQDAANRVLKVKGTGAENPLCIDLIGDTTALSENQEISFDFMKTGGGAVSCGLRFQSHQYGGDYYEISFPLWWYKPVIRKASGWTEQSSAPFGNDGQVDSNHWFTLTVRKSGGTVSCRVERKGGSLVCEGAMTDSAPFTASGQDSGIQLVMAGDAGEVLFDNITVRNLSAE